MWELELGMGVVAASGGRSDGGCAGEPDTSETGRSSAGHTRGYPLLEMLKPADTDNIRREA